MKTVTSSATKQIITGTTDKGKKCYAVLTDLRLSKDDFKALMADIRIAEGYGFTKYFAEYKKSLITAVNIEPELFLHCVTSMHGTPRKKKKQST
jgi:hypothetical protein